MGKHEASLSIITFIQDFEADYKLILHSGTNLKTFTYIFGQIFSKTCLKRPIKMKTKIGFQDWLLFNAGQKYCRMLQYSAILSNFIKLPFSINTFVLSIFKWPLEKVLLYNYAFELFAPWVIFHAFCRLLIFFQNQPFWKKSFMNTIWVSNRLDPDQARCILGLIWVHTVRKGYQQTIIGGNELIADYIRPIDKKVTVLSWWCLIWDFTASPGYRTLLW